MGSLKEICGSEGIPQAGYEFAHWKTPSVLIETLEGEEDPLRWVGKNKEKQNRMEGSPNSTCNQGPKSLQGNQTSYSWVSPRKSTQSLHRESERNEPQFAAHLTDVINAVFKEEIMIRCRRSLVHDELQPFNFLSFWQDLNYKLIILWDRLSLWTNPRLVWNSWFLCLSLLSAGIMSLHHYTGLYNLNDSSESWKVPGKVITYPASWFMMPAPPLEPPKIFHWTLIPRIPFYVW